MAASQSVNNTNYLKILVYTMVYIGPIWLNLLATEHCYYSNNTGENDSLYPTFSDLRGRYKSCNGTEPEWNHLGRTNFKNSFLISIAHWLFLQKTFLFLPTGTLEAVYM